MQVIDMPPDPTLSAPEILKNSFKNAYREAPEQFEQASRFLGHRVRKVAGVTAFAIGYLGLLSVGIHTRNDQEFSKLAGSFALGFTGSSLLSFCCAVIKKPNPPLMEQAGTLALGVFSPVCYISGEESNPLLCVLCGAAGSLIGASIGSRFSEAVHNTANRSVVIASRCIGQIGKLSAMRAACGLVNTVIAIPRAFFGKNEQSPSPPPASQMPKQPSHVTDLQTIYKA